MSAIFTTVLTEEKRLDSKNETTSVEMWIGLAFKVIFITQ